MKKDEEMKVAGEKIAGAMEHPGVIRWSHWIGGICVSVLIASGLEIFRAFPSFGSKIPQKDLIAIPQRFTLGGWLGGALQWHFSFAWGFLAAGIAYLAYQALSGHYRQVLFVPRDVKGVWPMARHYFLFGPKPEQKAAYNPLQKLAYTSTIGFGVLSAISGFALYKPVQLHWLVFWFGGFRLVRVLHFAAMIGFLSFIPGHLAMVAIHGWNNFASMVTGWKRVEDHTER